MNLKFKSSIQHDFPSIKAYRFGSIVDGNASLKDILGGKGANLAEMSKLGIPIPSGFTLPCEASIIYSSYKGKPSSLAAYMHHMWKEVKIGVAYIEDTMGHPTLLSVRSGARVSMPGMMDTILNVGITSTTLPYWVETLGPRAAYDSYRRLIQMYSSIALGVPMSVFDTILDTLKKEFKVTSDTEITDIGMKVVAETYLATLESMGIEFPNTPAVQLRGAILSVFRSWDNPRAEEYRKLNNIPYEWGTAVTIQSMVFGNLNDQSATGVMFTRDPSTGSNVVIGEYLVNAQGEDVVAGIRTPLSLHDMIGWNKELHDRLLDIACHLEKHYKDMQDIEFTIQDGQLYILQTRNGKRSAKAAFIIANHLVVEGIITAEQAVSRVNFTQLLAIMADKIDPDFCTPPSFTGIAAGGGLVTGVAVFDSESAINCNEPCILVRHETSPDDLLGINASKGILTATGGLTSHAAVVARGMNKTCVVGVSGLVIENDTATQGLGVFGNGEKITIDGTTGNVWVGLDVPVIKGGLVEEAREVLEWSYLLKGNRPQRVSMTPDINPLDTYLKTVVSEHLYIDTATFNVGGRTTDYKNRQVLVALGQALNHVNFLTVTMDLTPIEEVTEGVDQAVWTMFGEGLSGSIVTERVTSQVNIIAGWGSNIKSRLRVKLPKSLSPDLVDKLCSILQGVTVQYPVRTVADLLKATSPVAITEEVILGVFGGFLSYNRILALIEKENGVSLQGETVMPEYWYQQLGL